MLYSCLLIACWSSLIDNLSSHIFSWQMGAGMFDGCHGYWYVNTYSYWPQYVNWSQLKCPTLVSNPDPLQLLTTICQLVPVKVSYLCLNPDPPSSYWPQYVNWSQLKCPTFVSTLTPPPKQRGVQGGMFGFQKWKIFDLSVSSKLVIKIWMFI